MQNDLREHIDEHMPHIDELLAEQNIPINKRFFHAARLFVETAVLESSYKSNQELLESEVYRECILPLFSDWYFEKYGDLAEGYNNDCYAGMAFVYGQPVSIKIPATTKEIVEEGKLIRMTFPDHLQDFEEIEDLIQPKFDFRRMGDEETKRLRDQIAKIVSLTRSINLDLNTANNPSQPSLDMIHGIWNHFEKAISDVLTLKSELASIACWEIHLAIEKSLKTLIHDKSGQVVHGHNLNKLIDILSRHEKGVESSKLSSLPSDKDAIKLRYAEMIKSPVDAFDYYMIALEFVGDIVSRLERNLNINNASLTLKMAPWAR